MSDKLTLWDIDDALHSLLLMREEEGITDEERAAIDGQIKVWCEAQVTKVDGIRAYLKHAKLMEEAASAEAASLRAKAATWEARAKRLKEFVIAIMEQRGVKRLEGRTGQLRIQANGGKRALRITREDLVPDEYCFYGLRLSCAAYQFALRYIKDAPQLYGMVSESKRTVDETAVRKALESKCVVCGGSGSRLDDPEGEHYGNEMACNACAGTGHQLVPGAELEPRGEHLRVE